MRQRVSARRGLVAAVQVPGDKSISHRALILGALAEGATEIRNFLQADDCLSTWQCLEALGVSIVRTGDVVTVQGVGLGGLREAAGTLFCGNSGTTMRLLTGLLAGQGFRSTLDGDASLRARPLGRVVTPLCQMGGEIGVTGSEGARLPIIITGRPLTGIEYPMPIPSAQVKSALLLAGLYATGSTTVVEPMPSRDHTERMLAAMGARITRNHLAITIRPGGPLHAVPITVPGDFSSAAFLLVAGTLLVESRVSVEEVGLNPSRTGLAAVLQRMGAAWEIAGTGSAGAGEPVGWITARTSALRATEVTAEEIPSLIDELPILAVAATQARGVTVIRGAGELRVKETDRIRALVEELGAMGARIEERPDGFAVHGPTPLHGAAVQARGDHRMAMALAVAGLTASGETVIEGAECVSVSFPRFWETMGITDQGNQ